MSMHVKKATTTTLFGCLLSVLESHAQNNDCVTKETPFSPFWLWLSSIYTKGRLNQGRRVIGFQSWVISAEYCNQDLYHHNKYRGGLKSGFVNMRKKLRCCACWRQKTAIFLLIFTELWGLTLVPLCKLLFAFEKVWVISISIFSERLLRLKW